MFNRFRCLSLTLSLFLSSWFQGYAQTIVDPCFSSISPLGYFNDSEDIINLCKCYDNSLASDLIEWSGAEWNGRIVSYVDLPPPPGCNARGLWIGNAEWTLKGEAFALRLDKPLVANQTYTYSFTYAKDGNPDPIEFDDQVRFSPVVYTDKSTPALDNAYKVGRLPSVLNWETHSITFKATSSQAGHEWILLHAVEISGTVLSNCNIENPIKKRFLQKDTTFCINESLILQADEGSNYQYSWNTGDTTSSIVVTSPGDYSVEIQYGSCTNMDSINVLAEDCEVRMVMPNVFTPNETDDRNPIFTPMTYNYIESGEMIIYNRWGTQLYSGDLFDGWDGTLHGAEASTGIYYYIIYYQDKKKRSHLAKGTISLMR